MHLNKEANARLIAAAPDLLEALKLCLPILETHEDTQLVGHEGCLWPVELARAAIAKAMGQADNCPRSIYCCGCQRDVPAVLVTGKEIYPHRKDLWSRPIWRCPNCGLYVGCHYKTDAPTTPLGTMPTAEMRAGRNKLHALIDPLWQKGGIKRKKLYREMGKILGLKGEYHTAETRSMDELRAAYQAGLEIKKELGV
jgi:hypothetical protein